MRCCLLAVRLAAIATTSRTCINHVGRAMSQTIEVLGMMSVLLILGVALAPGVLG